MSVLLFESFRNTIRNSWYRKEDLIYLILKIFFMCYFIQLWVTVGFPLMCNVVFSWNKLGSGYSNLTSITQIQFLSPKVFYIELIGKWNSICFNLKVITSY